MQYISLIFSGNHVASGKVLFNGTGDCFVKSAVSFQELYPSCSVAEVIRLRELERGLVDIPVAVYSFVDTRELQTYAMVLYDDFTGAVCYEHSPEDVRIRELTPSRKKSKDKMEAVIWNVDSPVNNVHQRLLDLFDGVKEEV